MVYRKERIVFILRNVELFNRAIFQFGYWVIGLVHLIQDSFELLPLRLLPVVLEPNLAVSELLVKR